jgi:hypothetical protein
LPLQTSGPVRPVAALCLVLAGLLAVTSCGADQGSSVVTAPPSVPSVTTTAPTTTTPTQPTTPTTAEAQAPVTPAALAASLRKHPFPTASLGFTVSLNLVQAPTQPGGQWLLAWQAPATTDEVTLEFFIDSSREAVVKDWNSELRTNECLYDLMPLATREQLFWQMSPSPAYCAGSGRGIFTCFWLDGTVDIWCYGGPPEAEANLCGPLFTASQQDFQEVDPTGGF